jgi:hypothetical protein
MKVNGSLASLVQGVSQQPPNQRRPGQHGEQINMMSDPVRGLSRRHGTQWMVEKNLALDADKAAANLADSAGYRTFDYTTGNRDLTVLYRVTAQEAGSDLPMLMVYDRTSNTFLDVVRNVSDTLLDALIAGGASAITAVGKYVMLAGNTIVPQATSNNVWADAVNQNQTVLWVRGGAYARTYKATVTKTDDSQVSFEYTTPAASYPNTLDTSIIPAHAPDTAGAGTASLPTEGSKHESDVPTPGTTHTLTQTPNSNFYITYWFSVGESLVESGSLVEGVDFTRSGTLITWLDTTTTQLLTFHNASVSITYKYLSGGSTSQTTYTTEATTETLYVAKRDGFGVSRLVYGAWAPTGMAVKNGVSPLTNVHPAQPANAGEYAWAAGGIDLVLHESLVDNPYLIATYTHTKVVPNPNYTQLVAQLTADYNAAVTKYIGDAAKAIQPENIAEKLKDAATTAGLTGVTRYASTVVFTGVKDINFSDSGDGSLLRGVAHTVNDVAALTDAHYVGKIVRVSPTGGESFYMKALAENPAVLSGVTEVRWVEGAGVTRTLDSALVFGVADGGDFYVASSAALLNAILPGDHPTYGAATVGDDDSSPLPYFVGRTISYLGVFQDRLLVGCGAVIRASRIGDYLQFFRSTVLSLPANDPLEMLSQGSEDDVIRYSVLYDRDLLLFGRRQYAISGRVALTPTSANMPVLSSHEGANDAQPYAAGSLIFYAKRGQDATSVFQIEPGRVSERPEAFPASSQLDDYLAGNPVELSAVPKPQNLFVRTSGARNSLFVFSYLDSQDKRLQDCWHRWDYSATLGPILGTTAIRAGLVIFTLRQGLDVDGDLQQWLVADLQPLAGQLSDRPYFDSNRLYDDVLSTPGSSHENVSDDDFSVAFDGSTDTRLIGAPFSGAADLLEELDGVLYAGVRFASEWTPTNPQFRDPQDRAINTGRLVVTSLLVSFRDSSGFTSSVTAHTQTTEFRFNGRLLGDPNNMVGVVPVTSGKQSIVLGREASEYTQTIRANDWLPLNLTAVDWTGQLFHRPQRVT